MGLKLDEINAKIGGVADVILGGIQKFNAMTASLGSPKTEESAGKAPAAGEPTKTAEEERKALESFYGTEGAAISPTWILLGLVGLLVVFKSRRKGG